MLKRDLSYELFSREPEDWARFTRIYYTSKRANHTRRTNSPFPFHVLTPEKTKAMAGMEPVATSRTFTKEVTSPLRKAANS